jgi:hypothetical protein
MHATEGPYRSFATAPPGRPRRPPLADADILIPLVFASPAFLAVAVRTMLRGEAFGAGATVCASMVVLAVALVVSAWRARAAGGRPTN